MLIRDAPLLSINLSTVIKSSLLGGFHSRHARRTSQQTQIPRSARTSKQLLSSSNSDARIFGKLHTRKCADNIDSPEDNLRHIRVAYADGGEDRCPMIEEAVGTCQQLERKDCHTQYYPVEHSEAGEYFVPQVVSFLLGLEFPFYFLHLFPDNNVIRPNAV